MGTMWRDLWQACRTLWRMPAFTVAAVLTLAVGIGVNTAIFSVVEAYSCVRFPIKILRAWFNCRMPTRRRSRRPPTPPAIFVIFATERRRSPQWVHTSTPREV